MTQIAFANVTGGEFAPRIDLKGRRRRLDRIVRAHARHVNGAPFLVSVHRRGEIFAPTEESVWLPEANEAYPGRTWADRAVARDEIVLFTLLPQGGSGSQSGAKIGMAVAAIALVAFAWWAGPAIAKGLLAAEAIAATSVGPVGNAITAGILVGGGALLSALAQQKAPGKLYGVTGGGTLGRPNERIPVGYGRFWHAPDLAQPDYFTHDGDDMTLYKRLIVGCGKYRIRTIRAGATTLWAEGAATGLPNGGPTSAGVTTPFTGTQVEFLHGQPSALVPGDVLTSPSVSGAVLPLSNDPNPIAGPFVVTPVGVEISRLQVDYSYPNGYWKTNTGTTLEIDMRFEYAPIDDAGQPTGPWQTLYRETNPALKVMQPKRFTRTKDVPLGRYAVRAYNNLPRLRPDDEAKFQRNIQWDALRGHMPDVRVREGLTELCMKIRSGKSLTATAFADIQVEVERLGPVWNGSEFVEGTIRNCVDCYVDVLRDQAFGGGVEAHLIDLAKVRAYQAVAGHSLTFDGLIRGPVSLWDAARTIMFPFRAEPVRLGAGYSFVRDEPKAVRRHTFSRRQIVRNSTSLDFQLEADDGTSHVIVAYTEAADPKRKNTAEAYYGMPSTTPRRIEVTGISTYAAAVETARWLAAAGFYRRSTVSFQTELAGRLVLRGDPIAVDSWFVASRQVAGVTAAAGLALRLDMDLAVMAGDYAMLRDRGGQEWGPVRIVQGGDPREVVLNAADVAAEEASSGIALATVLGDPASATPSLIVGPIVEHGEQWLVESQQPKDKGLTAITAKLDSAQVYNAIGAVIPPDTPLTWPLVTDEAPAIWTLSAKVLQHTSSLELQWAALASPGAARFEVQLSQDGADYSTIYDGAANSGAVPLRYSDTPVQVRARAYGATGVPGAWSQPYQLVVPKPVVTATDVEHDVIAYTMINGAMRNALAEANKQRDEIRAEVEELAQGQTEIMEQVTEMGIRQGRRLVSVQGQAEARLIEMREVFADPVKGFAKASELKGLQAEINDPVTGLAKTRAEFTQFSSTQATLNSATASSLIDLAARMTTAQAGVDANASALASTNVTVSNLNGTVSAQVDSINALQASVGGLSANGLLQFRQSASLPGGAVSGVQMLVKATDSGGFAEAGIEAYARAGQGGSPSGFVVLVGDGVYARASSPGSQPFKIVDSQGRYITAALAPGSTMQFLKHQRPTTIGPTPIGVGTPNTTDGTNSWYQVHLGALDIVPNAEAVGSSGAMGLAECHFRLKSDVGYATNSFPVSNPTFDAMRMEFAVIAWHANYGSVLINDPPVGYPLVTLATPTSVNWSAQIPAITDSGLQTLPSGTWNFYLAWRICITPPATAGYFDPAQQQPRISGSVIVRTQKR